MKRESVCPVYDMSVIFCDDREQGLDIINKLRSEAGRKLKDPNYCEVAAGCCVNAGDYLVFCVFEKSLSIVAHEAVHAASKTLRERGIKIGSEDDHENLTYLVEWYFNEWLNKMGWKVSIK